MTLLSIYSVPCITEGILVFTDYRYSPPTQCPHNIDHEIDINGVHAQHTLCSKSITIKDNNQSNIGNNYRADQFEVSILGGTGTITNFDITYPYNIAIYSMTFLPTSDNVGDSYNIVSQPNTIVGTLTSPLNIGATGLSITDISQINSGYNLSITDDVITNDLGIVTSISVTGGIISFTSAPAVSFDTGSKVMITIPRVTNGKFINNQNLDLGFSKIGTSCLPAGKIMRVQYVNSTFQSKTLNFIMEFRY